MKEKMDPQIKVFLDSLLAERQIDVPAELKETMIDELNQRLQVRFQQIITEQLSEQDLAALDELAPSGQEAVQAFLRTKIANIDQLLMQAMAEFRQAFLEG